MDAYSQYDISENDPYLIENSECLKNKLGITNTAELNDAEQAFTKITLADLAAAPEKPTYNLDHLQRIHKRIFGDVYLFAGELRCVEISKGNQLFLPYHLIESEAARCFDQLKSENYLSDLSGEAFGERAGFFLGWINKIHSFREGNGRAQRVQIDQLAAQNGYAFEWSAISSQAMAESCRQARTSDPQAKQLSKLLSLNMVRLTK